MARFQKVIDRKEWSNTLVSAFSTAVAQTNVGGTLLFLGPATILRCRGFVQASFDATVQVGDRMNIAFGLGVFSSDAVTAGAGSLPDPFAEPEFPWMWWGTMRLSAEVAAGSQSWGTASQRLEVDTKAMRKIKPGQSLAWVSETSGPVGAPTTDVTFGITRVLIGT